MPPSPLRHKRVDQYQEMLDNQDPCRAQEKRDEFFMDHLPRVQAASRRLQSHLDMFDSEAWPLPPVPGHRQQHIDMRVEPNTNRIQTALEVSKDFGVDMSSRSKEQQSLNSHMVRQMHHKSDSDEKASKGHYGSRSGSGEAKRAQIC